MYCQHCKDDDYHPHYPVVRIRNWPRQNRDAPDSKWSDLSTQVEDCLTHARPKYKHYLPLLRYLDNEMIRSGGGGGRMVTRDMETLEGLSKEIDWIIEQVAQLKVEDGVFEILAFDGDYKHVSDIYQEVSYLKTLNEDIIYKNYYNALIYAGGN
jgi:hypothetical protein